jgi:hypothetical protein
MLQNFDLTSNPEFNICNMLLVLESKSEKLSII